MKRVLLPPFLLMVALASPALAGTKIKLDTVPAEYRPDVGAERIMPVSMENFYFEVNRETSRARVVVEYTFPHQVGYLSDGDPGPRPTLAQLPGLTYGPSAHAVVYDGDGKRTVCAVVEERKGLRGTHLNIKNTGACVVTATFTEHSRDDGWSVHRFRAIDTYFEVH
jgi:hypothetical protein